MKIQYEKVEGGFIHIVDGTPRGIFRVKGWMNNLLRSPEFKPGQGKVNKFLLTQYREHGKWE